MGCGASKEGAKKKDEEARRQSAKPSELMKERIVDRGESEVPPPIDETDAEAIDNDAQMLRNPYVPKSDDDFADVAPKDVGGWTYDAAEVNEARLAAHRDALRQYIDTVLLPLTRWLSRDPADPSPEAEGTPVWTDNASATHMPCVATWLSRKLPEAAQAIGIEYKAPQLRLQLYKTVVVLEDVIATGFVPAPAGQPLPAWAEAMAQQVRPEHIGNVLFALFLYTVDSRHCACASPEDCQAQVAKEWAAQKTDSKVDKPSHTKPSEKPPNNQAHGFMVMPWAVMNWALRVHRDSQFPAVRKDAQTAIEIYAPFQHVLYYGLRALPQSNATVFRGIRGRVTHPYQPLDKVLWPAFSSTALEGDVARGFMGKDEGTFFIINTRTAAMINFISWFPLQMEALITCGGRFIVQKRMSNTLLSMLGSRAEFITMMEVGATDALSATQRAQVAMTSVRKTEFVFATFLKTYVEGFLAPLPNKRTGGTTVSQQVTQLMEAPTRQGLVIVGSGGTGKTSALLSCLSFIMTKFPNALPVFVPLPGVGDFMASGSVDEFIRRDLQLDNESVAEVPHLCVFLDSLDEVAGEITNADVYNLMDRNPMIAKYAKTLILSTRGEFLQQIDLIGENVFGPEVSTIVRHVQPFDDDDMLLYLERQSALSGGAISPDELKEKLKTEYGYWELLRNPFLLFMAVTTLVTDKGVSMRAAHDALLANVASTSPEDAMPFGVWELQEAYITSHIAAHMGADGDVAGVLQSAMNVAVRMQKDRVYQGLISVYAQTQEELSVMKHLPLRIENAHAKDSSFSFRHKTIQEFLVARAMYTQLLAVDGADGITERSVPALTIADVGAVSLQNPNISKFFSDRLMRDTKNQTLMCAKLAALVRLSTTSAPVACNAAASNGLAFLARAGVPIVTVLPSMASIQIAHSNLDGINFSGVDLNCASITVCSMRNANLSHANVEHSDFSRTNLGVRPTFVAHTKPALCADFSPSDAVLASSGSDNRIILWDLKSASLSKELVSNGHTAPVASVRFSKDGRKLLSAGQDNVALLWNIDTLTVSQRFEGHTSWVTRACFNADGSKALTGSYDFSAKVWDTSDGSCTASWAHHEQWVLDVAWSPNDKHGATASADDTIAIWDAANGSVVHVLSGHTKNVSSVAFSPDSANVVSGSPDMRVLVWSVANGSQIKCLEGHSLAVRSVSYSPDGKWIASAGEDKTINVWSAESGSLTETFQGHHGPVNSATFSPDTKAIVSASHDKAVKVWELTGGSGAVSQGHADPVTDLSWSPNAKTLLAVSENSVTNWVPSCGIALRTAPGRHLGAVSFHPSGDSFYLASWGSLEQWSTEQMAAAGAFGDLDTMEVINCVNASPDGKLVAAAGRVKGYKADGYLFNADTRARHCVLNDCSKNFLYCMAFSPDSSLVCVSGHDRVSIRKVDGSGEIVANLEGHSESVRGCEFSRDGKRVVTGSVDSQVMVWDASSGECEAVLSGHTSWIACVTFGQDSDLVVSGAEDKTLRIWNWREAEAGTALQQTLYEHSATVRAVAFNPSYTQLASCGEDNNICIFHVPSGNAFKEPWLRVSRISSAPAPFTAVGCLNSETIKNNDELRLCVSQSLSNAPAESTGGDAGFDGPGVYVTSGYTANDYDGNKTIAEYSEFIFAPGGSLEGTICYGSGGNYNKKQGTAITGRYTFDDDGLKGDDRPPTDKWTQYEANHQFHYVERYNTSEFYYSGRFDGNRLVGRYKMSTRNAIGSFEWVLKQ